jgi:type VI secretion system protein
MALRVSIVSEHATRLGAQAAKVFGVHGGSIGRGRDNEWMLPDPERYLSGKHARVEFRAGKYYLIDTSSNGTYVNGSQVPLGRFHEYALQDGDYVRIGEYELLVSIDPSNDFPPDESAIVAYDGATGSSSVRKSTADDLGADLDLSALLEPSGRLDADVAAVARNAYGQAIERPDEALSGLEEPAEAVPWHMLTRPLSVERASAPTPRVAPPPIYDGECDAGLAAFCRGAGLDPQAVSLEARAAALQLAGQLLRETVLGLVDLNQGRKEQRSRLHIAPPPSDGAESMVRFDQGVEETLLRLLSTTSKRAGSVEAMREKFRELKAENAAMVDAMHAALAEFLARFDPQELEQRFERGAKRGVFQTQNKARYWDLYADLYAGLSQRPADGLPHWFVDAFAKAYEAKLRSLAPPRRGAFGAGDVPPAD